MQRRAYKIKEWTGAEDFLDQLARGTGKLGKGGEPDLATAAKMLLYDWQRGKLPFFTLPPDYEHRPQPNPAGASATAVQADAADEDQAAAADAAAAEADAVAADDEDSEAGVSSSESEDALEVSSTGPFEIEHLFGFSASGLPLLIRHINHGIHWISGVLGVVESSRAAVDQLAAKSGYLQ